MGVDAKLASLSENLKVEDPWVAPKTWDSIPSESGLRSSTFFPSSSDQPHCDYDCHYDRSALSESSLVRLAMNGMQGVKSSLISIQKLSAIFCSDPADRTFLRISDLWNRASSSHSLGSILKSVGCIGSLVFLLHEFVVYFTNTNADEKWIGKFPGNSEVGEGYIHQGDGVREEDCTPYSLVNQAFAVAVGKVLEGYICGLDTICASVILRRSSKDVNLPPSGCLKSVVHSEITLLEFYLHTKELRTQIEALGSICNLQKWALCFSHTSFEDLITEATSEFCNFCRGGDLLTFLYVKLQVADPAHCTLLKFLFLQACEPYCGFVRSWIFKAEIHDPYKEFIVENVCSPPKSCDKAGSSVSFPLASIRERDGVSVPGFLKDSLAPLVRAGLQLQVLLKLLEMCIHVAAGDHSSEDFLPTWSGFSSSCPSFSSPLTFSKDTIEAIVLARDSYYEIMNKKIESLLSSLKVRYQQVGTHAFVPSFDNGGGSLDRLGLLMSEDKPIVHPTADERSSNMGIDSSDSDVSSSIDEFSLLEDMYGSSESSSFNGSKEQLECDQLSDWPFPKVGLPNHLSALNFSKSITLNSSIQNSCHCENSGSGFHAIYDKIDAIDHLVKSSHEGMRSTHLSNPPNPEKSSFSDIFNIHYRETLTNYDWAMHMGHLLKYSFDDDGTYRQKVTKKHLGCLRYSTLCHDTVCITDEDQSDNNTLASNFYTFQPQKIGHQCNLRSMNPLSKNPMLTRNALLHLMGRNGENHKADSGQTLPYYNFSTVEDHCKVYMDKLPINSRYRSASSFPLDSSPSTYGSEKNQRGKKGLSVDDGLVVVPKYCFDGLLDLMDHSQDVLKCVSGGSSWERLLGGFRNTVNSNATHKQSLLSTFEIPLDIIIDKCLLQEIMLQYKYVSKLTITVLEEAFKLRVHLLALRQYHFMELADWADLFILSLWHHKWCVTEANEQLSEIQGLLELSIQKSSCEQDLNKDRLFVYIKGHGKLPLSSSAIGVRSFDFLGLGYHVDWPLSIIVTPAALQIYADIFSFLIQVKLAMFSLTDVWRSLKDLVYATNKDLNSETHQREAGHLNILMKMRHQVSHFVYTLQQYVESQLSRVSWCRFLHSLQHKVKDMMDLESVHMEYLGDSLCICFLSDDTRVVGTIVESILQCALDFRSCLTADAWDTGSDQEKLLGRLSGVNISQVLSIKQNFDKSLKELHLCYINAPKHGHLGLSRFWEYLNFNEYYSHVGDEMGCYPL